VSAFSCVRESLVTAAAAAAVAVAACVASIHNSFAARTNKKRFKFTVAFEFVNI